MAHARMPEAFFDLAAHHLPPDRSIGPAGGRPPLSNHDILKMLWFVLTAGIRWEDVPTELGCSGRSAHRFLQRWEQMGCWSRLHADLLRLLRQADKLDPDLVIADAVIVRAFGGGELTGKSPVDRGKPGSKHTLLVERHGVPLVIRTAGANVSDHRLIIPLVISFPKGNGASRVGPRNCPMCCMRIEDMTATPHDGSWLGWGSSRELPGGTHHMAAGWARSAGWSSAPSVGSRDCAACIRYDRLGIIQEAWDTLAASVICFRLLHDDSQTG